MLFNSLQFLVFLPIVFVLYFSLSNKYRLPLLFVASCIFYAAYVPKFLLVLFFLIAVDYTFAILLAKETGSKRKLYLFISIFCNIGVLFFFKYFNFFNQNLAEIASFLHFKYESTLLKIALPIGLSFHVFQSLSYVIEVYRGKYIPEKNILHYAIYVLFFPQLVAGPIERPQNLLPQLNVVHGFDWINTRRGLERMLVGFFKKLVIADQISLIVDPIFAHPTNSGPLLAIASILFTYQLYCDFSGYSDIAVGCAQLFGFKLMENFNRPFKAETIADFWRRWHISLSSWLRDYLYYPLVLGFGRVTKFWMNVSTIITFTLIGLWHGANWTYIVFGALHGLYLIIGTYNEKLKKYLFKLFDLKAKNFIFKFLNIISVFALVSFSLIFFRLNSLTDAILYIEKLSNYRNINLSPLLISGNIVLGYTIISIIALEIIQLYQDKKQTKYIFEGSSAVIRYAWYYYLLFSILIFGALTSSSFIYFQF